MRPGDPAQQIDQRQPDRHQHAVQDVEGQDARRGRNGEDELAATEGGEPAELGDVHQAERGEDDDRAERGRRELGEHGAQEEQHHDHAAERDE